MLKTLFTILIATIIFSYVLYIVIKTVRQIKNNENPCSSCPSANSCHSKSCTTKDNQKP